MRYADFYNKHKYESKEEMIDAVYDSIYNNDAWDLIGEYDSESHSANYDKIKRAFNACPGKVVEHLFNLDDPAAHMVAMKIELTLLNN